MFGLPSVAKIRTQPELLVIMNYPKIGIRPAIDGRLGGVRESLEEQTMKQALELQATSQE